MRCVLPLFAAALVLPAAARAQILSVYGTFSPIRASNVQTGAQYPPMATGPTYQYTTLWAQGVGGGVTLGALPIGPIFIGFDLRGSTRPGTVGADTAFGGVKVGLKLPVVPFKPYVQASGGYVATRTVNLSTGATANSTFNNQYAAYEFLGGVDYKFLPFLDLRLVEVGGGRGYNVTGITFNNINTQQQITILTVNSGVVLHF